MSKKYYWTTGPIRSSVGYDSTLVVVSNNSTVTRKIQVKFYDLGYTPKKLLIDKTLTVNPQQVASVDTERPEVAIWEVQISAYTRDIEVWVGGRRLNSNLPGNVLLNGQLQRF